MGLFRTLRRGATWLSLGAAAGAAAVTVRHVLETPQPLASALDGEAHIDRKHGGDIYYNLSGPEAALPLVLLHDFYPGASNFEFRDIFAQLARRYRVYAPDWLGFGMSEHPAVAYTGEFYAGILAGFLREVVAQPAVVLAHGHAANIAVRAAADAPELFERVILVAPDVFAGVLDEPTIGQTLIRATRRVSLGIVPYALLSTRPALRWLSTTRSHRAAEGVPDDEAVDHLYASAHQFGGQYALLAALTGDLDLAMPNAFALLEPPVLIISGEHDRRHPRVDMEDIAVLNPHADLDVIPDAGDTVFADQPDVFARAVTSWLDTPASRHLRDENALLQPEGGSASPLARDEQDEWNEQDDELDEMEEMPGTPSSIVPGVSDAGAEGPATVDTAGVTTLEAPTVTLGPELESGRTEGDDVSSAVAADAASPDELLPEAGEADPASAAEQKARAGVEPPRMPDETNIADEAPTDRMQAVRTTDDTGDAATVATPSDVAPQGDVETDEMGEPVVPASEEPPQASQPAQSTPTTSRGSERGSGARQSLSRARREPSPRSQPRTSGGTKSSRGGSGTGRGERKQSERKNKSTK